MDHPDVTRRERIQLRRRHLRARAASDSCLRHATRRCRRRREPYYSNPATWITIGIIVYIALVIFGMPDFCHMVNVGDDKKDLEEPLSPKEPQKEAIPRGANY